MKERERKRTRLGLRALRSRIQLRGLASMDMRTAAAKHLVAWKEQIVSALGDPSPQQLALVELAARAKAVLDHVDAYIMAQPSLINRRAKKVLPIVEQRTKIADHLAKLLAQLGLQRIPKPVPSLDEYLKQQYGNRVEKAEDGDEKQPDGLDDH